MKKLFTIPKGNINIDFETDDDNNQVKLDYAKLLNETNDLDVYILNNNKKDILMNKTQIIITNHSIRPYESIDDLIKLKVIRISDRFIYLNILKHFGYYLSINYTIEKLNIIDFKAEDIITETTKLKKDKIVHHVMIDFINVVTNYMFSYKTKYKTKDIIDITINTVICLINNGYIKYLLHLINGNNLFCKIIIECIKDYDIRSIKISVDKETYNIYMPIIEEVIKLNKE